MKVFSQEKKNIILFLSIFIVVEIIAGSIRNRTFYSSPTSANLKVSQFKILAQSVYNDNLKSETGESILSHHGLININDVIKDEFITLPKIATITAERTIKY